MNVPRRFAPIAGLRITLIAWRLPQESGGTFLRNQPADSFGLGWRLRSESDGAFRRIGVAESSECAVSESAAKTIGWMQMGLMVVTILTAIALAFMAFNWWTIRKSAKNAKEDAKQAKNEAEKATEDARQAKADAEAAQKIAQEMRDLTEKREKDERKAIERQQIIRKHTEAEAEADQRKKKALYEEVNVEYKEWLKKYPNELETPRVMFNRALVLKQLKRFQEEIMAYDELMKRFGDADEAELKDLVAMALVNKGARFAKRGKYLDAITAFDEVLKRFGDVHEPGIKAKVAVSLVNKGLALRSMRKYQEAITAFDEVVKRFSDAAEPELKEPVAKALINKGLAYACLANLQRDPKKQQQLRTQALEYAGQATEISDERYNFACVLALVHQYDEAFDELEKCLEGKEISWSHVDGDEKAGVVPDSDWDTARNHPRYLELKRKYGSGSTA